MIVACIREGSSATVKRPALVGLLWSWSLALALMTTLSTWFWWDRAFSYAPEADRLLDRFSMSLLKELTQYDRTSVWGVVMFGLAATALITFLGNVLVTGGTLEVLTTGRSSSLARPFADGAGRFFWRFLRAGMLNLIATFAVVIGSGVVMMPFLRLLVESAWEPRIVVAPLILAMAVGAPCLFFTLALDYARIRIALEDTERVAFCWISSLRFVLQHILATAGLLAWSGVLLLALSVVYLLFRSVVPSNTWLLIGLMIVVQQLFIFVRAGLRVALIASELECYRRIGGPPCTTPVEIQPT